MVRCSCIKINGQQCSRNASNKDNQNALYCWQHEGCQKSNVTKNMSQIPKKVIKMKKMNQVPKKVILMKKTSQIPEKVSPIPQQMEPSVPFQPSSQHKGGSWGEFLPQNSFNQDVRNILKKAENQGNINVKSDDGYTALTLSVSKGLSQVVNLLLEAGADPNIDDSYQLTPLHRSASLKNPEIAQSLINYGANLNPVNSFGFTPLYLAIMDHNILMVDVLIQAGAKINAKDIIGRTPMKIAKQYGTREIMYLLMSVGGE